jgi:hypothetical protein
MNDKDLEFVTKIGEKAKQRLIDSAPFLNAIEMFPSEFHNLLVALLERAIVEATTITLMEVAALFSKPTSAAKH